MKERVVYYTDLLNDDFAGNNIKTKELPKNFKYVRKNIFYRIITFIFYHLIVRPIVFIYVKIKYSQKFINKKALKECSRMGYFCYGNHTNGDLDAFVPSLMCAPKKDYIIVNPDATSIKGIRSIVMMLGAIPIPSKYSQFKDFLSAIETRINEKKAIIIYPEAHIWPYYNSIRPFKETSFLYPYKLKAPVFAFINVYKKRRFRKKPKVVTYIEGPFYFDYSLSQPDAIKQMRDKVYDTMKRTTDVYSDCEYIKYRHADEWKQLEE